jgi:uncharacterized membrane protein YcjF (UPF0283 family)
VMGQSFFAGEIEEHSEDVASSLTDAASSVFGSSAANTIGGKIAGKAGQGIAHFLLLNRIGRNACKLLRPLL